MSNKTKWKLIRVWRMIRYHSVVMIRGVAKMLYGTAASGFLGLAVYRFLEVSRECGWTAVCNFIAASLIMIMALTGVYVFGCKRKRGQS